MDLFHVYSLFDITPVKAQGSYLWDDKGNQFLDFYGGHAVISIGHSHPHYVRRLTDQLNKIGFYSNSVHIPQQQELADKLGPLTGGYEDYALFLCNSGAEANENALKAASFATGRKKVIAFKKAFHGRTSGAVAATDNPKIIAPFNSGHEIVFVSLNDKEAFAKAVDKDTAAVIMEGIQGVGGIRLPEDDFLQFVAEETHKNGAFLIMDEVQSGCGRTGKYYAHQHSGVKADIVTMAKGIGNGFPVGALILSPDIKPWNGELGTTFGGNYLACAAATAVCEVMQEENLTANAAAIGQYLIDGLNNIPAIHSVRGRGLMIGFDVPEHHENLRRNLLFKHHIFTGASGNATVRLLPALNIDKAMADTLLDAIKAEVNVPETL